MQVGSTNDRFPIIEGLWDFYSAKGPKTVFLSVGSSPSPLPELDLCEMLGCPLYLFETRTEVMNQWTEIREILKTRKATDTTSVFAKDALKKWVLPRNLHVEAKLPFFFDGQVETSVTCSVKEKVEEICEGLGFAKTDAHIDLLKIDIVDKEDLVLSAILRANFRPSLILIRWSHMPDENLQITLSAGHLQTLGYHLLEKKDDKFLYYFADTNYYESCSWEQTGTENPLVSALTMAFLPGKKANVIALSQNSSPQ
jgi:hypothetical protein